jgi:uncharacterized membrane protein YgcG
MFVFWIKWLSFALLFIGVFIFTTQRYIEKSEEREFNSGLGCGRPMPGDVHDYSGWGEGGRSESWSSSDSGGGNGGGGNS